MYKIGDRFRPIGRHFASSIYVVTDKEFNEWTQETLYTIEHIGFGKSVIYGISEDVLIEKFTKI